MQPITPDEAKRLEGTNIPPLIIATINAMIVEKISGGRVVLKQDEVVERILLAIKQEKESYGPNAFPSWLDCTRADVFKNKWLDFEPVFRRAGWIVEFDRPGYNESYDANWTFKANR